MGQKRLSAGRLPFLKMLLSNDLLGHKNMTLPFAQKLSKYLVDHYKLFREACQAR